MIKNSRCVRFSVSFVAALFSAQTLAGIVVEDPYIRGLPPGQETTAAFFRLTNQSGKDCDLVGASSTVAGEAEIHAHIHREGMMQMRRVDQLKISAGETVVFEPGSYHLMLIGVQQPLVDGSHHSLTLLFSGCAEQVVEAEVRSVLR